MTDDQTLRTITLYEALGGEQTIRTLVRRFYELMDSLPEARECRAIHGPSLAGAEEKLYEYLTGWTGGPQLYQDKYGHPMLRRRHLPAPIGPRERDGWLLCFRRALNETVESQQLRDIVFEPIQQLAFHMQNKQ
jgi:hemoglobin